MSNELVPLSDIEKMGKAVAASGLFGVTTENQAITLMLIAQAEGVHPAQAAMTYHIIKGKPTKKAEAMFVSFVKSGGKVKWITLNDTKAEATFSHPEGGEITLAWDMEMAKKAGLFDKEGSLYKKYPRAMLRSRLIAEGVRTIYPAATGGMMSSEEAEDIDLPPNKSRLDDIIEAELNKPEPEMIDAPKDTPEPKPEVKESKSKKTKATKEDGVKSVTGTIAEAPKVATVEKDGKPQVKHSFKVEDKFYGTFDTKLAKEVMDVLDIQSETKVPILIRFEYTERVGTTGKTFQDITKFNQVTTDKLPI